MLCLMVSHLLTSKPMTKFTFLIAILSLLFSCKSKSGNVKFHFTTTEAFGYLNDSATFKVHASLTNSSSDTVYFYTTTCDGEKYSLQCDTAKFRLFPNIICNTTYPKIAKIAPNDTYSFVSIFLNRANESSIKLGFDFYEMDRFFDLSSKDWESIHNRPSRSKDIIWAPEQIIAL